MEPQLYDTPVKYNAGVDTALYLNGLFKQCDYFARNKDFVSWFDTLKCIYRWIYPKLSGKKNGVEEVNKASAQVGDSLGMYQRNLTNHRKIPSSISFQVYNYLANYEMQLRKWSDKLGYGMPESDDISTAAFR